MFRLASAKVRRGFELAKLSGNIFSKNLLTGRFCRVRVAIHGDKRGSEGRGGPRSGTSGNGGEGRKTEGRERAGLGGTEADGRRPWKAIKAISGHGTGWEETVFC